MDRASLLGLPIYARWPWRLPWSTAWLDFGGVLPVYLLFFWGSISLLRGKDTGYKCLYAAMILTLVAQAIPHFPLSIVAVPPTFLRFGAIGFWFVNVAIVVLLIATHFLVGNDFQLTRLTVRAWCPFLFVCAVLVAYGAWKFNVDHLADELASRARRAYDLGDRRTANSLWSRVHQRYPLTSSWGIATFNSGITHKEAGRYQEAIGAFGELLYGGVNDFEPSPNLMEAYRNYRHRACVQVSDCYEAIGDYDNALDYAYMARDKYPYESWCGTCLLESHGALQDRIRQLEDQVGKNR